MFLITCVTWYLWSSTYFSLTFTTWFPLVPIICVPWHWCLLVLPITHVPQYLCFSLPFFPDTFVSWYLYSLVLILPGTYVSWYLSYPVPMFPVTCVSWHLFRLVPIPYSSLWFLSPVFFDTYVFPEVNRSCESCVFQIPLLNVYLHKQM